MSNQPRKSMPPQSGWPALSDWHRLLYFAALSLVWLAVARWRFGRISVRAVQARNERAGLGRSQPASPREASRIAWIAFALPRVANRVPWRSDCLVQAMAAQDWLSALGLASQIVIGVEKPADGDFGSHAWLTCGDTIVTGGESDRYTVIVE